MSEMCDRTVPCDSYELDPASSTSSQDLEPSTRVRVSSKLKNRKSNRKLKTIAQRRGRGNKFGSSRLVSTGRQHLSRGRSIASRLRTSSSSSSSPDLREEQSPLMQSTDIDKLCDLTDDLSNGIERCLSDPLCVIVDCAPSMDKLDESPVKLTDSSPTRDTCKQENKDAKQRQSDNVPKSARRSLRDLAVLLRHVLPARVERKRTESVLDQQSCNRRRSLHPPSRNVYGTRVSICEKQWTKYGVLVQYCSTFAEALDNPSLTTVSEIPSGVNRTLMNADFYVQQLWRDLQLTLRGEYAINLLDQRNRLAKIVIHRLSNLQVKLPSEHLPPTPCSYLERVTTAHSSVASLLTQADQVERSWSSDARLSADVVDWVLPEVSSRLACLRQWHSRLSIITRGVHQLCNVLQHSSSSQCDVHPAHLPGKTKEVERVGLADLCRKLHNCPLLMNNSAEERCKLFHDFLYRSIEVPRWTPQPSLQRGSQMSNPTADGGSFSSTGYSNVLFRLNRLMYRILEEVRGERLTAAKGSGSPDLIRYSEKGTQTLVDSTSRNLPNSTYTAAVPVASYTKSPSTGQLFPSRADAVPLTLTGISRFQKSHSVLAPSPHTLITRELSDPVPSGLHILRRMWSYASVANPRFQCVHSACNPLEIAACPDRLPDHISPVMWNLCSTPQSSRACSPTPIAKCPSEPRPLCRSTSPKSSLEANSSSTSSVPSEVFSSNSSEEAISSASSASSSTNSPPTSTLLRLMLADQVAVSPDSAANSFVSVDLHYPLANALPMDTDSDWLSADARGGDDDDSARLGLPSLLPLWLCVARVPFEASRAAVATKLTQYAERLASDIPPSCYNMACLANDMRQLWTTAVQITYAYRKTIMHGLRLNSVVQPRIGFHWSQSNSFISNGHSVPEESPSTRDDADFGGGGGSYHPAPRPSYNGPTWFYRATDGVRQFIDGGPEAGHSTSLADLIEAYTDCFIRLVDDQCSTGVMTSSEIRCQVQDGWDFVRTAFRRLQQCRGGLHYTLLLHRSPLRGDEKPRSIDAAFVRVCERFLGFLADRLGPLCGTWVRLAVHNTVPTPTRARPRSCVVSSNVDVMAVNDRASPAHSSDGHHQNGHADNLDPDGWLSPRTSMESSTLQSSLHPIRMDTQGGTQGCSEIWRDRRAWLKCLLDLTNSQIADLDTAVMLNLAIPVQNKTRLTNGVPFSSEYGPAGHEKAWRKLARELSRTDHVLLYDWGCTTDGQCQKSDYSSWDRGCIFMFSPILQSRLNDVPPSFFEPDSLFCVANAMDPPLRHPCFSDGLWSDELQSAIRRHIATVVHKLSENFIFKSRRRLVNTRERNFPRRPAPHVVDHTEAFSSKTDKGFQSNVGHGQGKNPGVEFLLICPNMPASVWNGIVYRPSEEQGQSNPQYHDRSLQYAFRWLVAMCRPHSSPDSPPFPSIPRELPNGACPVTLWLLTDRPHAAWTSLRDSSGPIHRWLTRFLNTVRFYDSADQRRLSPRARSTAFQLAPIQPDLYAAVTGLRNSICNLSAQLQGHLRIMVSHLRTLPMLEPNDSSFVLKVPSPNHSASPQPIRRSVFSSRNSTAPSWSLDHVQRAYSVAFSFYRTSIRLLTRSAITWPMVVANNSPTKQSVKPNVNPQTVQTRLVNLGVQLLTSWADLVRECYPRGRRGRIPRWANDACHFADQLCHPRASQFIEAAKVESLELALSDLLPHLVGEDQSSSQSINHPHHHLHPASFSPSSSSPTDLMRSEQQQQLTSSTPTTMNGRGYRASISCGPAINRKTVLPHRRMHSLNTTSTVKRNDDILRSPPQSYLLCDAPRDENLSQDYPMHRLIELDVQRDERLREASFIGRPRYSPSANKAVVIHPPPPPPLLLPEIAVRESNGDHTPCAHSSINENISRRHFPYNWVRGRLIGSGSNGKVFEARNTDTNEKMAVKEIPFGYDYTDVSLSVSQPGVDKVQSQLEAFRRECDLLSGLSHPTLVRFICADEQTPKVLRLFTELCDAGTLNDIIKCRPCEATVRKMAHDLAHAVAYLHERGIVHRDIKPANIFLVNAPCEPSTDHTAISLPRPPSGSNIASPSNYHRTTSMIAMTTKRPLLKLGDFGHSLRLQSASGTAHGMAGTVRYMAPEVCRSTTAAGYSRPCDIWSYCCVLLHILTAKPPWFHVNERDAIIYELGNYHLPLLPIAMKGNVRHRDPADSVYPPGVTELYASHEAIALLRAGLVADPDKRPTASSLLHFDFLQFPE